ncbi:MAG: sporulation protein YabP [Clostridia bacterium]|nr:sporulation protein YabP [Clostridia bacterium]
MNSPSLEPNHDVLIKSRKRMEMTGVNDVSSFDETEIIVQTDSTGLSIEGEGLKIEKFNSESGELVINGSINGMFYYNKKPSKKKKSFSEIFK